MLFTEVIDACGGIANLVRIVRVYFTYMDNYIHRYTDSHTAIVKFNEWRWLDFRSIFIRVYRQPSVLLRTGKRAKVIKFEVGTLTAGAGAMRIPSGGSCFTPELLPQEEPPSTDRWKQVEVNVIGPKDIGIGAFNWWAAAELRQALLISDPDLVRPSGQLNLHLLLM